MSKRIVIALGGNALGSTAAEQLALVSKTAKAIVDLIAEGNEVVIAHGNGPQVGMINLGLSTAAEAGAIKADMPFPECGAMSEGYIGYHLQQAIGNELTARGIRKPVATIVTQTVVSQDDPAFQNPTKPVGAFYDKETADRIAAEKGYTMVEDAGRGYRQVVPSPKPFDIVEAESIKALFNAGHVVIAVGGGGIPVVRKDGRLCGTPAVIDKDFGSELLAELLDACRGAGGHQLQQARPEGSGRPDPGPGQGLYGREPVRQGLHAAQGPGCGEVRRVQGRPHRPDHPAGEGQGRHRRQDRYPGPSVKISPHCPQSVPRPAGNAPSPAISTAKGCCRNFLSPGR